jgi:TRAP-type C4-dicarboxylate transport system permease small subunit
MRSNLLATTRRGLHSVIMVFTWIGAAALIILVLTTFANVVGRYLLRMPLTGAVEISELFLVVTVFFGVAYTEVRKQHVTFDEVVFHFPRRLRAITIGAMYFLVGVYALIISWQETLMAISYMVPRIRVTDVLKIPIAPAIFVIAIGSLLWGIELMLNALSPLAAAAQEDIRKQEGITEDEMRRRDE